MKILFDLNHPAHVHFFRHPIEILQEQGCEVLVTSRAKEMAIPLLEELGVHHETLSSLGKGGMFALGLELVKRDIALARVVFRKKPQVLVAIGGTFVAHVGLITRTPSLVFYDTENAKLQNAITYPFATRVIVPRCYGAWVPRSCLRYPGYHELSYLHPLRFVPDRALAVANGLDPDQTNFFIRTVSWQANHDVGERGWNQSLLETLVDYLAARGKVHISSEVPLPPKLNKYAYCGRVSEVHHLMAYCRLFIGESATMASECAVLGVPAIYAAHTGRGYTDEQETRYGMVKNLRHFDWDTLQKSIESMLAEPEEIYTKRREKLLTETIDVAAFVADLIEQAGRKQI